MDEKNMKSFLQENRLMIILLLTFFALMMVVILRTDFSSEIEVDPEYYSGMLTLSGILFGFSTIIVNIEKPVDKIIYVLLFVSIITFALAGDAVFNVVLGRANHIEVITKLRISVMWNMFTTSLLFAHKASWKTD